MLSQAAVTKCWQTWENARAREQCSRKFLAVFSSFQGQRSVTAALATRSPWSIIIHETLVVLIFSTYGPISPAITFGCRSWKFHGSEASHWFLWLFFLSGTMVGQGFRNRTLAIKSRKNIWANKISASWVSHWKQWPVLLSSITTRTAWTNYLFRTGHYLNSWNVRPLHH